MFMLCLWLNICIKSSECFHHAFVVLWTCQVEFAGCFVFACFQASSKHYSNVRFAASRNKATFKHCMQAETKQFVGCFISACMIPSIIKPYQSIIKACWKLLCLCLQYSKRHLSIIEINFCSFATSRNKATFNMLRVCFEYCKQKKSTLQGALILLAMLLA